MYSHFLGQPLCVIKCSLVPCPARAWKQSYLSCTYYTPVHIHSYLYISAHSLEQDGLSPIHSLLHVLYHLFLLTHQLVMPHLVVDIWRGKLAYTFSNTCLFILCVGTCLTHVSGPSTLPDDHQQWE